jgi:hypothetical protein
MPKKILVPLYISDIYKLLEGIYSAYKKHNFRELLYSRANEATSYVSMHNICFSNAPKLIKKYWIVGNYYGRQQIDL